MVATRSPGTTVPIPFASGAVIDMLAAIAAGALMTAAAYATVEPARAADHRCTNAHGAPTAPPHHGPRGWIIAMPHVDPHA